MAAVYRSPPDLSVKYFTVVGDWYEIFAKG
jgi:hypothetical protein